MLLVGSVFGRGICGCGSEGNREGSGTDTIGAKADDWTPILDLDRE